MLLHASSLGDEAEPGFQRCLRGFRESPFHGGGDPGGSALPRGAEVRSLGPIAIRSNRGKDVISGDVGRWRS